MRDRITVGFHWDRHPGGRPTQRLRAVARGVMRRLGVETGEIGVLVTDDTTVRTLNRHFRGKDTPTDVLSFPSESALPDGTRYLGDIAISLDTARRQAREAGIDLETELANLLVHAVLHLRGFDHETDDGEMEALERSMRRELVP